MANDRIVTRFAPSPTGYLHIGGARTALFNWAFARRHGHGGKFILRIEDTDKARSTPEATRRILADLKWLGIDWDEGPTDDLDAPDAPDVYDPASQKGEHGPYFQSQRGEIYKAYLQRLIDAGRAYPEGNAYRFKMPGTAITVNDLVLGDVTIQAENLEDFVIFKSDGGPTFHFANVVDDAEMGVTHVLRAQEHLMNTPKHVAMFDALGIERPRYAHMPLIFNADGSKMSKRDKAKAARQAANNWLKTNPTKQAALIAGVVADARELDGLFTSAATSESVAVEPQQVQDFLAKKSDDPKVVNAIVRHMNEKLAQAITLPEIDVHDFRVSGYLPEVILNYIALLGWSPGGDIQRFTLDWFRDNFSIEGIGKSNARFDRAKLLAFNGEALQRMPLEQFKALLRKHRNLNSGLWRFDKILNDESRFTLFAQAYQPRTRVLADPFAMGQFLVVGDYDPSLIPDQKTIEKVLQKNDGAGRETLDLLLHEKLKDIEPWDPPTLHKALEDFAATTNRGMGDVAQPLRVAVTGTTVSPAIHDTLAILGKDATLDRIQNCLIKTMTTGT